MKRFISKEVMTAIMLPTDTSRSLKLHLFMDFLSAETDKVFVAEHAAGIWEEAFFRVSF